MATTTPGAVIRDAGERSGLSQAEVARRAGTSQSAIARYETGRTSPMIETLHRCIEACGLELRIELDYPSAQRRAAADAALARSVEDRLRTNDAFAKLAFQLRHG